MTNMKKTIPASVPIVANAEGVRRRQVVLQVRRRRGQP